VQISDALIIDTLGNPKNASPQVVIDDESAKKKSKRGKRLGPAEPTDRDYEMMPTENLDWEKITPSEKSSMKEWFSRRENELTELAAELQRVNSLCPLGRDRTFRRYWVFRSVPGLFVENDEPFVPDEFFQTLVNQKATGPAAVAETNGKSPAGSDKENVPDSHNGTPIRLSGDAIAQNGTPSETNVVTRDDEVVPMQIDSDLTSLGTFESVHDQIAARNSGTSRWSFFNTTADLDSLINSLNKRGLREGPLRATLLEQKLRLVDSVNQCDAKALSVLNPCDKIVTPEPRARGGKGSKAPLVVPKYTTGQEHLEINVRELLLDLEERVWAGSIGSLKVSLISSSTAFWLYNIFQSFNSFCIYEVFYLDVFCGFIDFCILCFHPQHGATSFAHMALLYIVWK